MAFESLTEKLQNVFKNLRSKGRLTEEDIKLAMREVRMALLEADVSYKVVKDFVAKVSERAVEADVSFKVVKQFIKSVQEQAVGQDVMNGLNPGQMVIKIVNDELVKLMGSETTEIALRPASEVTIIMMAGLQGAGKTTTTAKIAENLSLPPVTSIARQRSNSCRSTEKSRVWKCSLWEIKTVRWISQRQRWCMQRQTALTY